MNKPFAIVVADRGGHWDEWLVGAQDKEEAVGFVRTHFGLAGRKLTAYDMTDAAELAHTCGVYGVPRVVDHDRPHFLPVPAMSGADGHTRRAVVRPLVEGSRNTALTEKKRRTRGRPVGACTVNRKAQVQVRAVEPPEPVVEAQVEAPIVTEQIVAAPEPVRELLPKTRPPRKVKAPRVRKPAPSPESLVSGEVLEFPEFTEDAAANTKIRRD